MITFKRRKCVLDGLAARPAVAYGCRLLNAAHAGPIMRVRRGLDNATRDIYPDRSGNLDWPDLLKFANPTNAYYGVLDGVAAATAACFALRRLRSGHNGNAILVRRTSDNSTQAIGFDAAGNLNTAALLSFCGTFSGHVVTWYDQSGNGRDVTQATQALQGQIVSNGALVTKNGVISVNCAGGCYWLTANGATWMNMASYSLNFVGALAATPTGSNYMFGTTNGSTSKSLHFGWRSSTLLTFAQYADDADYALTPNTSLVIFTATKNGASGSSLFYSGTTVGSSIRPLTTLSTTGAFVFANGYGQDTPWNGFVSEACIFSSVLSTRDRLWLEYSQSTYFKLGLGPVGVPHSAAAGSAFVSVLYDQFGKYDLSQPTAALQPCVAALGSIIMAGNSPSMLFATEQYLKTTTGAFAATYPSFNAVASLSPMASGSSGILSFSVGTASQNDWNTATNIAAITRKSNLQGVETAYGSGTRQTADVPAYNTPFATTFVYGYNNAAGTYGDVNGTASSLTAVQSTTVNSTVITLGARNDNSGPWAGYIAEVMAFATPLSLTDIKALEYNQGGQYAIATAQ